MSWEEKSFNIRLRSNIPESRQNTNFISIAMLLPDLLVVSRFIYTFEILIS